MTIEEARRWYAEEIRAVAHLTSDAVVEAFARVPREAFLGAGRWQIARSFEQPPNYRVTADGDPRHIYHNVLIAIDPARRIHRGGEPDGGGHRAPRARRGVPRAPAGVLLAGVIFVVPAGRHRTVGQIARVFQRVSAHVCRCRSRASVPDSAHTMGGTGSRSLRKFALGLLIAGCGGGGGSGSAPSLLPDVVDHSGPVMAHLQLVPIFYTGDPDITALTSYSQWIVGSEWLKAVGADYGVGTGSMLQVVQRPGPAPAMIDDTDIIKQLYSGLADGSLPTPAGGLADVLYMIYFPASTTITAGPQESCTDFGGYHNAARQGGVELSYAVIAACARFVDGLSDLENREVVASHELIEAATDPVPNNHPGFQLDDPTTPWSSFGSEVADLCQRGDTTEIAHEAGFIAQRSWSIAAAGAEQDPCVPGATPDYFNLVMQPSGVVRIAPGGHQAVTLRAWASGAARGTSWQLDTGAAMASAQTLTLGATTIKDGATVSLDVALPASAQIGDQPQFVVFSSTSNTNYSFLPMYVVAGDACSRFTTCEECTSEIGCGFCASSGKCEAMGGPSSSAQSSCSGGSFATWPGSCKGFCASHSASCVDCASQPGCGWCSSGQPQCVEASHDTGQQASGSCPYAAWNFTPDYCSP